MDLVTLQHQLDNLSFLALFLAMLIYWVGIAFPQVPYLKGLGTAVAASANLSIAALLGARWLEAGYFPISNLYESLFFLAWGITASHLAIESFSGSRLVGAVAAPLAMGVTAFATLSLPEGMQASAPLVPALKSNWLMMHVSVMMLSYATLLVGSLVSVAFLVVTRGQDIELQGSSYGTASNRRLLQPIALEQSVAGTAAAASNVATAPPPPATVLMPQRLSLAGALDNISYRTIGLGFPLLTVGIIAGAVWANEAWGSYWSWDPKETWALIVWLVFAAYLHARITRGWQGRRPALLASAGFVAVWVCYLGVNFLGQGLHSYGWFF